MRFSVIAAGAILPLAPLADAVAVAVETNNYPVKPIRLIAPFPAGGTSAESTPPAPGMPGVAGAGVSGYAIDSWWGLLVPAGTPREIIVKLNGELLRILKLSDVKEKFFSLGVETIPSTQEQFAQKINVETVKYSKFITEVGVRVE